MKPVLFEDLTVRIDRLIRLRGCCGKTRPSGGSSSAGRRDGTVVGERTSILAVKTVIRKVAPSRTTVLVTGRNGYRQGASGQSPACGGACCRAGIPGSELCGDPARSARKPTIRSRSRSLHRRDRDQEGLFVAAGQGSVFSTRSAS